VFDFEYHNPTRIVFGKDRLDTLERLVPADARVLVTYGGGSAVRSGLIGRVRAALCARFVREFGGIEPNPQYDTLMKAVDAVRADAFDFLLAVGGGSVIDGTKFVALAAHFDGDPATLPARQVANGIVDAFVHTTEQYLMFPAGGLLQDRMAEAILSTLIEIGKTSVDQPDNYDVRAQHVWTATMALNGLIAVGVPQDWATHMIGHELTALFGIDHGQSLAIVLPSLLEVRRDRKLAKLVQFAERVWGVREGTDADKADAAIAATRAFFESLGVPTRLSGHGIGVERIPEVIEQLKAHGMVAIGETRDLTPDIAWQILHRAV